MEITLEDLSPHKRPNSKGENLASLLKSLRKAHDPLMIDFIMAWIAFSETKPRSKDSSPRMPVWGQPQTMGDDDD